MHGRVRPPALMVLLAMGVFGQDSAPTGVPAGVAAGSGRPARPAAPGFTGHPYSAEFLYERVRTLADGTQVTEQRQKYRIYRDSAGRTRREGFPHMGPNAIDIADPVAHVSYTLNVTDKLARRRTIHLAQERPSHRLTDRARPQFTLEKLGEKTIEGLPVTGTRGTTIWPAGSRGNDQPIAYVAETWISPDLHLIVLHTEHDQLRGNVTQKLININRAEPDPGLFRPPADYTIVDDAPRLPAAGMRAVPVPASVASAAPPPEAAMTPEPAAEQEDAPSDSSAIDEPALESEFADVPPADAQADPSGYVGVNAVYVGVTVVNPPASKAPASANPSKSVAAPSSGPGKPVRPKHPQPKPPAPDQPVK